MPLLLSKNRSLSDAQQASIRLDEPGFSEGLEQPSFPPSCGITLCNFCRLSHSEFFLNARLSSSLVGFASVFPCCLTCLSDSIRCLQCLAYAIHLSFIFSDAFILFFILQRLMYLIFAFGCISPNSEIRTPHKSHDPIFSYFATREMDPRFRIRPGLQMAILYMQK